MKIFFMVSSMGAGGAERVAANLCNAWADAGHTVTLLSTHVASSSSSYHISDSVDLIFLGQFLRSWQGSLLEPIAKLKAIRSLIRAKNPDVVISFLSNVNLMAILATRFIDVPLIIGERTHPGNRLGSGSLELACRHLYRFADLLTVQTDRAAAMIGQVYSPAKHLMTIPNPVSRELLSLSRKRHQRDDERRRFIALGRLSVEKCVGHVIEAFARCCGKFPDWYLDIYGDGPLHNELKAKVVSYGLEDRIQLFGLVAEPWTVLSQADAFVMASEFEGFPNSLLEALCIGLPAIATDCASGPREVTDDGRVALLVPVGDVAAIAACMERLMADPALRDSLGNSAKKYVRATFGMDAVLALWDTAFAIVVRQSAR